MTVPADTDRARAEPTLSVTGIFKGLLAVPGTMAVTTPENAPCCSCEPLAVMVMVLPDADAVSQPLPFSMVATAPMVMPDGTPVISTVWLAGGAPPKACAKVILVGAAVTLADATTRVTGIICAGTLAAVLDTVIEPL